MLPHLRGAEPGPLVAHARAGSCRGGTRRVGRPPCWVPGVLAEDGRARADTGQVWVHRRGEQPAVVHSPGARHGCLRHHCSSGSGRRGDEPGRRGQPVTPCLAVVRALDGVFHHRARRPPRRNGAGEEVLCSLCAPCCSPPSLHARALHARAHAACPPPARHAGERAADPRRQLSRSQARRVA